MAWRNLFTKKKTIIAIIVLLAVGGIGSRIYKARNNTDNIIVEAVKRQDIRQTVLATGQIVSKTELKLSFQKSGTVSFLKAKVGDEIKKGQIVASLDQKNELASLTQAQANRAQAEANYQKVLAGATSEEIKVSRAAVASAQVAHDNTLAVYSATQQQQDIAVKNAHRAFLNSGLTARVDTIFDATLTATISGTYGGGETGEYNIKLISTGYEGHYDYQISGIESDQRPATRGLALPLGTRGLFITFGAAGTMSAVNSWTVKVPNPEAATYVANQNAYQAALETQRQSLVSAQNTINSTRVALEQAQASLALKQATARPEDIAGAKAQISAAVAQVQAAQAALADTQLLAPADGTVTAVDIKIGELATAQKTAVVLQDIGGLHIEANISEANVVSIKPGQSVQITLDAFGPDRQFTSVMEAIDPASTVVSGVVNYKVTASIEQLAEIRPGLTANMTVLTAEKSGVLTIPQRAVLNKEGSQKAVRVITDSKKKTYEEKPVFLGIEGDGGLVEVLSGLAEGEDIVTFIKAK